MIPWKFDDYYSSLNNVRVYHLKKLFILSINTDPICYFKKDSNCFSLLMEKYPIYKVKAGIFAYDQETKKVKVKKDKGLLTWFTVV